MNQIFNSFGNDWKSPFPSILKLVWFGVTQVDFQQKWSTSPPGRLWKCHSSTCSLSSTPAFPWPGRNDRQSHDVDVDVPAFPKNNPRGFMIQLYYTLVDLLKLFYTVHGKNSSALRFFKISFRISLNHGEIDLTSTRFKRRRCLPPFWGWKSFASTIGIPQLSLVHPGNGFNWQVECEDPETWKRFRSKLALSLEVQPPYSSRSLSSKRNHHF